MGIICLNPYSDGRWLLVFSFEGYKKYFFSLNPYSDGRWLLVVESTEQKIVTNLS